MRQTTIVKNNEIKKEWFIMDAQGATLGRLATIVASYLRGKHKPQFTPNVDMGDNIIVVNAEKIVLIAKKEESKKYYSYSGYPGGLKVINAATLRKTRPIALIEKAVKGMLPKSKLGSVMYRNLFVYAGSEHKHQAQKPKKLEVK